MTEGQMKRDTKDLVEKSKTNMFDRWLVSHLPIVANLLSKGKAQIIIPFSHSNKLVLQWNRVKQKGKMYYYSVGRTQVVGKGGLYSQISFIYKYKTLGGFIKGVSGGCFVLLNKLCYPQSRSNVLFYYNALSIKRYLYLWDVFKLDYFGK